MDESLLMRLSLNKDSLATVQQVYLQLMMKILERIQQRQRGEVNVALEQRLSKPNGQSSPASFAEIIKEASAKYQVDEDLIEAVIKAESDFDPNAQSSAGAQGLMQLMPQTAADLGVTNSFDARQNINGGVRFLKNLLDYYSGDVSKALAGYNAGPGAVDEYDGIPPYQETQTYVKRVMDTYRQSKNSWSV